MATNPVREATREVYAESEGDHDKFTHLYFERLRQDEDLYEAFIAQSIHEQYRLAQGRDRVEILSGAVLEPGEDRGLAGVDAFEKSTRKRYEREMLAYPMSNGKKLRDANREDLDTDIAIRLANARGNRIAAAWLSKILSRLPKSKPEAMVRDYVSEGLARKYWLKVESTEEV